jgi:hypothetical protein
MNAKLATSIAQSIDALYTALMHVKDPRQEAHLSNALDSLISALHGDEEKDED